MYKENLRLARCDIDAAAGLEPQNLDVKRS